MNEDHVRSIAAICLKGGVDEAVEKSTMPGSVDFKCAVNLLNSRMRMENTSIQHAFNLVGKKSPRLVVHWAPDLQTPERFEWDDGSPATEADYDRYGASTHLDTMLANGTMATIYDIDAVAFVRFDAALSRWVCTQGRHMIVLDLDDPSAADADIQSEVGMYDPCYRAFIFRAGSDAGEDLRRATGVNSPASTDAKRLHHFRPAN